MNLIFPQTITCYSPTEVTIKEAMRRPGVT